MGYPVIGQLGMGLLGKKIYQELDPEFTRDHYARPSSSTPLSEEHFASVWTQTDFDGIRRVHLQIVSNDQQLSFPENPPALSLNNHCENAVICRDLEGGAYVAWAERSGNDQWRIMLQRINSDGSPAWRQGGVVVTTEASRVNLYPSSDGGCFIRDGNIVFAYNQDGEAIEGWPLRGHEIGYLFPDDDGGFWFFHGGHRLYRAGSNGRIVRNFQILGSGIQIGTDCIFSVWRDGIRQPTRVVVYNFAGEVQRIDTLIAAYNNEAANWISMSHFVTPGNRLVAVYNHIDQWWHRYGNGEYFEDPMYAPRVTCYAPFEENRFPFRRNGHISIGGWDSWGENFQIIQVGENYLISEHEYGYTIYPFDHNGQRLWDRDHPVMAVETTNIYPAGENAWVFGGYMSKPYFAYQINDRAVRENDAEIVGFVPHQRERGRTLVFPTANGGCDILMVDRFRGLTGQYINSRGRLNSSLAANVLEPNWECKSRNVYSTGTFTNSHWAAVRIRGGRNIHLVIMDDNGNVQVSGCHEFDQDGIGSTDYSCPVGNGHDCMLAIFRNIDDGEMWLVEFNDSGDITRTVSRNLEQPNLLDYWPGQGWLYFDHTPDSDSWRANLIDDDLNVSWSRELDYQGSGDRYNPDQVAFLDTTAVVYWCNRGT